MPGNDDKVLKEIWIWQALTLCCRCALFGVAALSTIIQPAAQHYTELCLTVSGDAVNKGKALIDNDNKKSVFDCQYIGRVNAKQFTDFVTVVLPQRKLILGIDKVYFQHYTTSNNLVFKQHKISVLDTRIALKDNGE